MSTLSPHQLYRDALICYQSPKDEPKRLEVSIPHVEACVALLVGQQGAEPWLRVCSFGTLMTIKVLSNQISVGANFLRAPR